MLKTGSKQVNVSLLNLNTQFFINTIKHELKHQRVAAVDEIEVICRHTSDLKDYIYDPGEQITGAQMIHDVKQLFQPVLEKDMFKDENSAKRFDYLDFIIVDVPGTLLPW